MMGPGVDAAEGSALGPRKRAAAAVPPPARSILHADAPHQASDSRDEPACAHRFHDLTRDHRHDDVVHATLTNHSPELAPAALTYGSPARNVSSSESRACRAVRRC